ncbi:alpha-D-kanosaminyltransferase [Oxobacter pfennigii]|uniref:Alpha-D-kanosaminyltransferase n=1 Tax=Oxobacter pfennigii TaxID=36849 RepID=A0A0P8WMH4_9CLOT|nr:glycosyltransferase family 4 protein [Oxobacter pfennigii]KPU43710.1 alpha-D-kanosaminyltransferase [Oxobacter pfennigii]
MKRIMHIVQSSGGVERYILMLIKNMDLSKYENILVCSYDYNKKNYNGLVMAFEHVDMHREINFLKDYYACIKIRKLIKKYSPDVVYMHSSKAGAIGRLANIGLDNMSLYNPHGWSFNMDCGNFKRYIYRWIEKILSNFCTKIIAISEFEMKSALANNICNFNKIKVIFNGVDIEEYYQKNQLYHITKKDLGIPEEAYIFGTVGRLTKQKSPDVFINFAALIKKEIPNAYFILVGNGDQQAEIEEMIKTKKIADSVLITGWVDEPMQYIQLFDQAFLLSRWEGFGLVLAEYMLGRKPLVATNVNAIPDLIEDGKNGVLVSPDDPYAVYIAAMKIYKDEMYRKQLVKNGLECVKSRFDIRRVVKETVELL